MMRFLRSAVHLATLMAVCAAGALAQACPFDVAQDSAPQTPVLPVELVVPEGTLLRVALRDRVRIGETGAPVRGVVTHPVYAFDQAVIPAGSEVSGRISRVKAVSKKRRFLAFLNADFTPARAYELTLDSLVLPDGREIPIVTQVSYGVADVVRLVANPEQEKKRNRVAQAAAGAKKQVTDEVRGAVDTIKSIKSPGKWDRIKRYAAAQLPFRRQYAEANTRFSAVLKTPLDFGIAWRSEEYLGALGSAPAEDSVLEARLAGNVSSATAKPGETVEAVVTAPLFSPENNLVFPANSRLIGEVVSAKPARKLHRHGQLRITFKQIELPDGVAQAVQASVAGMEVDRDAGLQLDEEGGAKATGSKKRYFTTGLAIAVATLASQREGADPLEGELAEDPHLGAQAAAGGSGFRLVGMVMTSAAGSPVFSAALGIYGAAASFYKNFISRGREVNLPQNTPIEISLGKPRTADKKGQ